MLKAELEKPANWRALLPTGNNLLVALRELEETDEELVLHPVGTLQVSQKLLPLDLDVDKFSSQTISDAKRFTIEVAAGGLDKTDDAEDQFALAQFQAMDDATKLSRPPFQAQHSGVDLSVEGEQLRSSRAVKRTIRYEEIIIDNNYLRFVRRFTLDVSGLFIHFLKGASVSQSSLSKAYKSKLKPYDEAIVTRDEGFAVAFQENNKTVSSQAVFSSEAAARDFMRQMVGADPKLADAVHVIPQFEVTP